ncbi:uncharacterized protein LOC127138038 [Lathyrus oleraceus]|uniref:uncharacterized protein LOC127138038 n=1 Tax=Pisum sativum TaxID=3888 RepID=UPI0021D1AA62|nr:uncharacterized protein LOC127138038 [Pisum sativum]
MEDVTVDIGRPLNARNLKSMGVIEQVRAKLTLYASWQALKDQRKIPNGLYLFSKIDPLEMVAHYLQDLESQRVDLSEFCVDWLPERPPNFMKRQREPSRKSKKAKKAKLGETYGSRPLVPLTDSPSKFPPPSRSVKLKPLAYSLPQTTPIYTQSKTPPSTTKPSKPPSLKFNLSTTTLPVSKQPPQPEPEATTPPPEQQNPPSEQPQTPPPEQPATSPSEQQPSPPPEQTTPHEQTPPPEQTPSSPSNIPTIPTSEDIIIPTLQTPADTNQIPPSSPSPNSEPKPAFPTLEEAITLFAESSVEKIKSLDVGVRLQARLVREAEEKARKEAEEKAFLEEEQRIREAEEKVVAEVAATEAEAKAKAKGEEATCIAAEEAAKASVDALNQWEQSNSSFAPLVLKTPEELKKGTTSRESKIGSPGLCQ